jgi:hypothetical protein
MVDALKGVNNVMEKVNASMDIHAIQQVLKEFTKNSEKMDMQQEMVSILVDILTDERCH